MNNKGFSVAGVLVASVFMSLILAASMQMMQYASLTANTNEARQGLVNLAQDSRNLVVDGKLKLDSINVKSYNLTNAKVIYNANQIFVQAEATKQVFGPKMLKPRLVLTITNSKDEHKNHGHEHHDEKGDCKHD
jgi:hypothetical protein